MKQNQVHVLSFSRSTKPMLADIARMLGVHLHLSIIAAPRTQSLTHSWPDAERLERSTWWPLQCQEQDRWCIYRRHGFLSCSCADSIFGNPPFVYLRSGWWSDWAWSTNEGSFKQRWYKNMTEMHSHAALLDRDSDVKAFAHFNCL